MLTKFYISNGGYIVCTDGKLNFRFFHTVDNIWIMLVFDSCEHGKPGSDLKMTKMLVNKQDPLVM